MEAADASNRDIVVECLDEIEAELFEDWFDDVRPPGDYDFSLTSHNGSTASGIITVDRVGVITEIEIQNESEDCQRIFEAPIWVMIRDPINRLHCFLWLDGLFIRQEIPTEKREVDELARFVGMVHPSPPAEP